MAPQGAGTDQELLEARRLKKLIRVEKIKSFEAACRRDAEAIGRRHAETACKMDAERPPVGNDETPGAVSQQQSKAIGLLFEGKTVSEAAEAAGISRHEIRQWLKDDTHFVVEYRRRFAARGFRFVPVSPQQGKVIDLLVEDKTVDEAAKSGRIPKCRVHRWLEEDAHFVVEYRRRFAARGYGSFDVEYEGAYRRMGQGGPPTHRVGILGPCRTVLLVGRRVGRRSRCMLGDRIKHHAERVGRHLWHPVVPFMVLALQQLSH